MVTGDVFFCIDEAGIVDDVCKGIAIIAFYAARKGNASTFLIPMPSCNHESYSHPNMALSVRVAP